MVADATSRSSIPFSMPFDTRLLCVGGRWQPAASGETLALENPSDGSVLAPIARGNAADIDAAVRAAQAALDGEWGRMTAAERGRVLGAIGRKVQENVEQLALLEALDVGKPLKQARADAVALATGAVIQSAAARNAVPVTLELGGKSPQIVFGDADLDAALPYLVNAGLQNAGQTCSAASRILVERSVYGEVRRRMAERYRALRIGPARDDLDMGPVISKRQQGIVEHFLAAGRDSGLRIAAQGRVPDDVPRGGSYVRPTLFDDVPADHPLAQQEIFGPVQVLIAFDGEQEAVRIANGTAYGLVAGVWTRDGGRQLRMARALKCGQVFINNYGAGGGVELPFGGVKHSGHGREKGFEALYGFSALKTVAIHHD